MNKLTTLIASLFLCTFIMNAQNFMAGWDGGSAIGPGSEPNHFGWISDNPELEWTEADSEIVGTIRYSTTLASRCVIFDSTSPDNGIPMYYDSNRLLIIRWDGNDVNFFAYKLSGLTGGKTYQFDWVYCWYDNADYFEPRIGVNKNPVSVISDHVEGSIEDVNDDIAYKYFFEITDDVVGPTDGENYDKKMTVHPSTFDFTVPEDGDYYLTFTCTQAVDKVLTEDGLRIKGPMAMVGGFSVVEKGGSSLSGSFADNVKISVNDGRIIVTGIDNYNIYTITGVKVSDVNASLNNGIYIVEAGGKAQKVIVK